MTWFSLDREIFEHWIYDDPVKFQRWVRMIGAVNHKPVEIEIGNEFYTCDTGESFRSYRSWATIFDCSTKAVRTFFDLLERKGMIERGLIGKGKRTSLLVRLVHYKKRQNKETEKKPKVTPNNNANNFLVFNGKKYDSTLQFIGQNFLNDQMKDRAYDFVKKVGAVRNGFPVDLVDRFAFHWVQPDEGHDAMRFEYEDEFDISGRLEDYVFELNPSK